MPLAESVDMQEVVDREKIKQEVFEIFCTRGIKTPAELDFFFTEFLNITIPKKRICPNHLSPFEIICDIYLNKPSISLWISSRGSGKTYLLSCLDAAHLVTKPDFSIIHSAAVQDQTNRAYEYFLQTHKDINIRNALDGDPTRSKTKTLNNSELSLITMTWQGTNCIRGNAKIDVPRDLSKYPDGIPFVQLKKQFDKGKELYAYGYDVEREVFTLSKIKNIWCSGIKPLWRVNYSWHENGKKRRGHIDSTSDHPYLLLNSEWRALKDLKKGDRFKILYRFYEHGYAHFAVKGEGSIPEHRFIMRQLGKEKSRFVDHHIDFNSKNNSIDNLVSISRLVHNRIHARSGKDNPFYGKKHTKESLEIMSSKIKCWWDSLSDKEHSEFCNKRGEGLKNYWENISDKEYEEFCERKRKKFNPSPEFIKFSKQKGVIGADSLEKLGESLKKYWSRLTEKEYEDRISKYSRGKRQSDIVKEAWDTRRANNNVVHNHVVESIECLNIEDKVYDMEVDGSFVANGLVVHNSPHVPLLVVDEVELIRDWSILQEALCIPQSKNGYRAQTVMMSTRKWNNGIVQRIVDESDARKIKVYESCIFEVLEKCTRICQNDPKFGNCPAYKQCKGKAHECEGFYIIDDFIEKILQLDEETIDAQYFCNKPLGFKGASVYEIYDNVHTVNWDYFKRVTGYNRPPEEWRRIGGVDFESVFVYVTAAIEPMTGRKWVYAEHYHDANKKGMLILDEHVGKIQNLESWSPRVKSWADPSAKQEIYELKRRGVPCVKSPKMAIRTGVDLIRAHLKTNEVLGTPMLMFIKDEVPQTIESLKNWSFHRNDDGTIDYDNYSDEDDHGADAVRYMLYGYHTKPFSKPGRARGLYG